MEIALAVLLVLSFPIIAIAGLVIAIGARDRVRTLEQRFADFQKVGPLPPPRCRIAERRAAAAHARRLRRAHTGAAAARPRRRPPRSPPTPFLRRDRRPPPRCRPRRHRHRRRPQPAMGFEERFGTRWTVWVGGVALAFGGFFLVRYSIEQGWFGPGMRVFLGGLLALALIAAGEWARRKENLSGIGGVPAAHIPSILTAAGTAVAYADIYAAFALYDFIGPATAFILLGIVALGTLAAALMHGPALAGLGLVGAYVTPLIVSTGQAELLGALPLSRGRNRGRLHAGARADVAMACDHRDRVRPVLDAAGPRPLGKIGVAAHAFHVSRDLRWSRSSSCPASCSVPTPAPGKVDAVSSGALAAYLFGALLIVLMSRHDTIALITFVVLTAAVVAIAWRSEAAAAAVPLAGVMVALMFLQYAVNVSVEQLVLPSGPTAGAVPEPQHRVLRNASRARRRLRRAVRRRRLPRPGPLDAARPCRRYGPLPRCSCRSRSWSRSTIASTSSSRSLPFAGIALLLAALFALATETLSRREPRPGSAAAARSSRPARSPRWRSRSPWRWRRAGSPSRSR